jgi:hypothetical protein
VEEKAYQRAQPRSFRVAARIINRIAQPKKIFKNAQAKAMVHEGQLKVLQEIEDNDWRTPSDDSKRTLFNESCGQRIQNDKLV